MRNALIALMLLAAAASPTAFAAKGPSLAISEITRQQAEIRSDVMAGTGRYRDMPEATKQELLSRQTRVLGLVSGKTSAAELDEADRLAVFNDLEWIEAAINDESGNELICKREKRLGTNRAERVCKTARQIEAEKEYARLNKNSGCAAGVCGNP